MEMAPQMVPKKRQRKNVQRKKSQHHGPQFEWKKAVQGEK